MQLVAEGERKVGDVANKCYLVIMEGCVEVFVGGILFAIDGCLCY